MKRKFQLVFQYSPMHFATAGQKAPADVLKIALDAGFEALPIRERKKPANLRLKRFMDAAWILKCIMFCIRAPKNATVLFQAPRAFCGGGRTGRFLLRAIKRVCNNDMIAIAHDLEELRVWRPGGKDLSTTKALAATADVIIVHNRAMARHFAANGVEESRIVVLGIFDYLTPTPMAPTAKFERCITIAGNLSQKEAVPGKYKSRYLTRLGEIPEVEWMLYGPGYDDGWKREKNVHYCGCFPSEELPEHLSKGFGLVWDGDSIDTCTGEHGEYLRVNNPHKLSLYMACGLPVVIWSEAAQADFVRREEVGFTIRSLKELAGRLAATTEAEYMKWCRNARAVGKRLRDGYYTRQALAEAEKRLSRS
ncbi:MAG: hypothetical protein IJS46_03250 [Kiritimatiellae bacterium]|nr:hypothetical protein [Kiritimatiellia bacterium]